MSRRPESSAGSSKRDPMESLVYSVIPSLAPSSRRYPTAGSSRALSGQSTSGSRPESRISDRTGSVRSGGGTDGAYGSYGRSAGEAADEQRDEMKRKDKVKQMLKSCDEVTASRSRSPSGPSGSSAVESTRRMLLASGSKQGDREGTDRALRFGGLWSKLEKGKTLASPYPHLQFLLNLSALNSANATTSQASSSLLRMGPPESIPSSSSRRVLEEIPPVNNVSIPAAPTWSAKGKSKAEVLKSWRISQARPPFSEQLLLRDVLYLLQGIDGAYVRFALRSPPEQNPYLSQRGKAGEGIGFQLGKEGNPEEPEGEQGEVVGINIVADEPKDGYISSPTRTLLMQIAEMGMLYRQVTQYLDSKQVGTSKGGRTEQSLCHFLHHELSDYHRLLAVLESQLNMKDPESPSEALGERAGEESGLTLLRLGLWTDDMRLKMRYLAQVVDDAKVSHGGALVSRIHEETNHGDPSVRTLMNRILEDTSKPFFTTLQRWIFAGELNDPFQEFFVQLNPDISLGDGRISPAADVGFDNRLDMGSGADEAHKIWEKKYVFVKDMVPGFVSEEFAKKIFSTGRSLNFIRYSCGDSDWIETQAKLANAGRALKYSDLAGLERSIDDAYEIASQRLLEVFFDKYALLDHLRALKSYLMLGMGDFAELLMEALAPRLSKPAISLYRHHLTSDLESAIRGSNAQYDSPDILRRLDARVLEYTHGEVGWDCFALEYKVEAPLNAVLDAKAMVDYDKIFHHLWKLKRVEVALTQAWMRVTSGSRLFESIDNVRGDWHHCRIVQAEMVHFLRQIQAFCQLEVIECSWQALIDFTEKRKGDLDSLIQAHRTYLDRVVRKVLLLSGKRDKEEVLLNLVREALDSILNFKIAADDLYAWSLGEATRLDRQRDEERGLLSTGPTIDDDPNRSLKQLRAVRDRVRTHSINFQDRVVSICHLAAGHADLDVRFLAIRIAFNGHYELRKSKKAPKSIKG